MPDLHCADRRQILRERTETIELRDDGVYRVICDIDYTNTEPRLGEEFACLRRQNWLTEIVPVATCKSERLIDWEEARAWILRDGE